LWIGVLLAAVLAAAADDPTPPTTATTVTAPRKDTDGDGIPDDEEDKNHNGVVDPGESDPREADSDHDNVPDAVERKLGTDPTRADDVPPIPEPLLVDLIRNLGSQRGELEANVVASSTFERKDGIQWGPEVEYAPIKNVGLECEVPIRDDKIGAVKGGALYTVGSFDTRRLEFAAMGSYQHGFIDDERLATLSVVTGVRFSHMVQALTILGPNINFKTARPVAGANISPSVFLQVTRRFTTGLELGYRVSQNEKGIGTILPQVHINPIANVKVQVGAGVTGQFGDRVKPLAAIRLSYEL
jgi:hypothetical protein